MLVVGTIHIINSVLIIQCELGAMKYKLSKSKSENEDYKRRIHNLNVVIYSTSL